MKKIISVLIINLILLGNLYGAKKAQVVTLFGDDSYPPYSYLVDGNPKGAYIDIIKAVFAKIPEYKVEFKLYPWKRDVSMVKTGKAMAFFPPYFTQERTSWLSYSEPIVDETIVVYAKDKKVLAKTKWPEDFYGLNICMNDGFTVEGTGGKKFKKAIDDKKIKLNHGRSNGVCLNQVLFKRSDFTINERLIDSSAYKGIKRGMTVKVNQGYLAFTKKSAKFPHIDDVRKKFNAVLLKMKADGEVEKILKTYMK